MYIDEALEMLLRIWHPKYNEEGLQDKALSGYFGLNPATFASYKAASRSPRDEQAKGMAVSFAAFLRKKAKEDPEIVKRLEAKGFNLEELPTQLKGLFAAASKRTEPASPLKKIFGAGDQIIRISGLDYGIFCGQELEPEPGRKVPAFFNALLKRYEKQMGIETEMKPRSGFDIEEMLRTGKAHLVACYFASAQRASFANFFPVPLRISLSAVFREEFGGDLPLIAAALYEPQQALSRIKPIVIRGEVGHQHCIGVLNLKETNMVVEDTLDVAGLAEKLLELSNDRGADRRIPCVVVDEYTATRVLAATNGAGRLALPLTNARTNRESKSRREMPEFLMSIAYSRDENKRREDFFHDSLRIFMNTEVETTARLFASAFFQLADEVFAAIRHLGEWDKEDYSRQTAPEYRNRVTAAEYAWYCISLDRATVENPVAYQEVWHRILRRARAIVLRDLFGFKRSTTNQIIDEHLARKPSPFIETMEDLQPLKAYFDHDLSLDDFRGLNRDQLFKVLEQKLNPEASQGEIIRVIEINQSKPLAVEEKYGVETLLKQLRMSYSEIKLNLQEGEQKIVREIIEKLSRKIDEVRSGKAPYSQILLAQASRNTPMGVDHQPAGLICIDSRQDGQCELRYLWVNERFRKKHIARLLLQKAIDTCRKHDCKRMWVAMLPELEDAIDRVRAAGFKLEDPPEKDNPELEMRLYFEYNLAREPSS